LETAWTSLIRKNRFNVFRCGTLGRMVLVASLSQLACRQAIIDDTDRQVYSVIADRQKIALGKTSDIRIDSETGKVPATRRMYDFTPRPSEWEIPESFRPDLPVESPYGDPLTADQAKDRVPAEGATAATSTPPETDAGVPELQSPETGASDEAIQAELTPDIYPPEVLDQVTVFSLRDALAYAGRHGRRLQDAKEALYRAALDLTLERHLWTPQFVATVRADYTDFEEAAEFDQTLTNIADFAVSQRLPFGGNVTARVVDTLVRDVNNHVTTGETGRMILDADIPLLRGFGQVAYESRYSAERELIYAVRVYENFRRAYFVDVASAYFNLQQLKTAIGNTYKSYLRRKEAWERADFVERVGRSRTISDASRAKSNLRQAEASLVSAKEQYESALDRFKVFVGMPVDQRLDVLDQESDVDSHELDRLIAAVTAEEAEEVAFRYRLDLLNTADEVDDAQRGVRNAENAILPDLDFRAGLTANTDPLHRSTVTYATERTAWNAGVELRMTDRKAERNAFRGALISLRQAERTYEEGKDNVRADVRRATRRIAQQENLRRIQELNVEENEMRLEAAKAQFDLGRTTNQDVVDAENDLLNALNDYADAVASYRVAILEFRRDTGTLRVTDDGHWQTQPTPGLHETPGP